MIKPAAITIISREVLDDIKSAAWLESELHPECDLHRRHEMADVCEPGNVEKVWRILGVCDSEVRMALRKILLSQEKDRYLNELENPETRMFMIEAPPASDKVAFLKEKIHEYFVASVMADRTAVIMPDAKRVWEERKKEASAALSTIAATSTNPAQVSRPLWPM